MRRCVQGILLAIAALAAAPAAPQPVRTVTVSAQDYPADVRPTSDPLRLRVRYQLARDGSVAQCAVEQSSGRPSIDAASCHILRERARFRPERGAMRGMLWFEWLGDQSLGSGHLRGDPIALSFVEVMSTADYPWAAIRNRESGTVDYEAEISETGVPLRCAVTGSSGSGALDRRTCEIVMARGVFIPASDGAGGRRRGVYRSRVRWLLPGG